MWPISICMSPDVVSMCTSTVPLPKGTSVMTWFIFTACGMFVPPPSALASSPSLRTSAIHSSLKNGYLSATVSSVCRPLPVAGTLAASIPTGTIRTCRPRRVRSGSSSGSAIRSGSCPPCASRWRSASTATRASATAPTSSAPSSTMASTSSSSPSCARGAASASLCAPSTASTRIPPRLRLPPTGGPSPSPRRTPMAEHPVLPGAEPFSASGGPHGALVLHGFTGSPQSMRGLAEAFAGAGLAVELPRLPGHGTAIEDMLETGWSEWSTAAERAYEELAGRCDKVVVGGLSMGGTLTLWLAERHPEIAGIVLVNPAAEPPAESFREMLQGILDSGNPTMPAVGNDIALPDVTELAYESTPVAPILAMLRAVSEIAAGLAKIECPVLLMNSPQDHVVPPSSSDLVAERVSGPLERVTLERSYHVATLDYDKDDIERRAVEFATKVTAS